MKSTFFLLALLAIGLLLAGCTQPKASAPSALAPSDSVPAPQAMMNKSEGTLPDGVPYVDYNPQAFQAALASGKTVYLEFHATWCPVCQAQDPVLKAGFKSLTDAKYSRLAAFRVDYDTYKDIERQYGVTSQHTHVIVNPAGERVYFGQQILDASSLKALIDQQLGA